VPGRLWLAGKHYVGPDGPAALASVGATAVVCLCEPFEYEHRYPDYAVWVKDTGITWPVHDLHAPDRPEATRLVEAVTGRLDAGDGLIVHCGAGLGRAGTIAAAVLLHYGVSLDDALSTISAARPGAGPQSDVQLELLKHLSNS
jgi:predicted protein tyrosine phosphatase